MTMHATEAFDQLIAHPMVLHLVRRLIGEAVCITGVGSAGIRDTPAEPAPKCGEVWPAGGNGATAPWTDEERGIMWQMWHREQGGARRAAPQHGHVAATHPSLIVLRCVSPLSDRP